MRVMQSFDDIDEHAAQMSGFDQQYVQLSRGAFRGVFSSLALPQGIGFDVEWVAQAVHQQGCVPRHTVSLVTFLDVAGRAVFNGHGVGSRDTFLLAPGTELNVRTPPGATIAVVTVPLQLIRNEMPAAAQVLQPRGIGPAARLLDPVACSGMLLPTLLSLVRSLETAAGMTEHPALGESMADELLDSALSLLGQAQAAGHEAVPGCGQRRRELFRSVLDSIEQLGTEELAVWKLCRLAGVSRRTLEYCFEEALAVSPLQYLKAKRLNAVRRELSAAVGPAGVAVTIGDVAARHGIWHLSRLSKDYAQLFGELPSATLRRSRAEAS